MTIPDPFGGPPREVVFRLPTKGQAQWLTAMLTLLGLIGSVMVYGTKLVAAIEPLRDVPERVRAIEQHQKEEDDRIEAIDADRIVRTGHYNEITAALAQHSQSLEDIRSDVRDVKQDVANLLAAVTGRPFRNTQGNMQR